MARQADRSVGGRLPVSGGQLALLLLVVVGGGLLGWQGYQHIYGNGSGATVPPVTYTVAPANLQQTATTSGNVVAPANSKLTFAQAGRLATLNVKQGQMVQKGAVIATLDTTPLQLALAQAQSQQNAAQAALDALNNGQTPDVIASAKAGVTAAQAGQVAAQSTLAQAQNSAVSANAAVGTAGNGVITAQDTVQTAQNTIQQDQAALQTAQNNYQALLNGPTAQQTSVAQASVDAASATLTTAQENYDRLVNHTDIATRPETAALVTASAAYQQALASLANAQPQAANPYDVQAAQLAVQSASNAVSAAQTAAQSAQTNLLSAEQVQACDTPPFVNGALCPPGTTAANPSGSTAQPGQVVSGGSGASPSNGSQICSGSLLQGVAICPPAPQPNPATLASAQQAATTAQNGANSAAAALITAQGNYQTALNALQKVLNPINTTDLGGLQAAVAAAQSNLDIARTNYNNYLNLPDLDIRPETTALKAAQSAYQTAQANYNLATAPPKDTDLATAQNAITTAQAQLDSARAAEQTAEAAVGSAQNAVTAAQATADNAGPTISSAASTIDTAAANTDSAQKKLDQLYAPPLSTDVTKATEAVNQAKVQVQNTQYNLSNAALYAPFSGVIASVTGNPGDQITAGTAIAQLVDTTRVELDAQVDETTYGQLKVGMPVQAQFDSVPNPARPGTDLTFTGFVTAIVPSGTTAQGVVTYPIVISLNPAAAMPPNGATASIITIILSAKQDVLAIPGRYLTRDAQGNQVVDLYQDGKRVPTKVETGVSTTTLTEITSGLKAGDVIAQPQAAKASGGTGGNTPFGGGSGVPGLGGGGGGGGGGGPVVIRGG